MSNLTYRSLDARDFADLHEIASDWDVVRQLGRWPWPADPSFTKKRCMPYKGRGFIWAILEDDQFCGWVAVTGCELGYMLHPKTAGRGIMTVAAGAAIAHAFETTDISFIEASVWHDNMGSQRVLTKLGLRPMRTAYEQAVARRIPTLCHYYRVSRTDWMALDS